MVLSLTAASVPVRAEDEMLNEEIKPAPKAKKKPAKKKTYDYDRSKYKSLAPDEGSTYKFNEKGDPITAETKKKAPVKKKKRSEPPEAGLGESAAPCGLEEACGGAKTEADAL